MVDRVALKTLIDSDPANAAKTDQQVMDWLNEPSNATYKEARHTELGIMDVYPDGPMAASDVIAKIEAFANDAGQSATWGSLQGAVLRALRWCYPAGDGVDFSRPGTRAMLGALAQKLTDDPPGPGTITTAERDKLLGLAASTTRWEDAGLARPKMGDVEYARG